MNLKDKQNYLAFINMLLATSILSNYFDENMINDSRKIIDFIGNVFKLNDNNINYCFKLISDDLTMISIIDDVDAYQRNVQDVNYLDISDYLYLKCETLLKLNNIHKQFEHQNLNSSLFDYRYLRRYSPDIRFKELENASKIGIIDINKSVAILQYLGIGCKKNIDTAIYRFKQCAYWGDISSLYFLAYIFKSINEEKEYKIFNELCNLSDYFLEGRTNVPSEEEYKYSKESIDEFKIISSIIQDIILSYNKTCINYSFIEVILLNNIDYYQKMKCINNYHQELWKEISNSSNDPNKKMGFNFRLKGGSNE